MRSRVVNHSVTRDDSKPDHNLLQQTKTPRSENEDGRFPPQLLFFLHKITPTLSRDIHQTLFHQTDLVSKDFTIGSLLFLFNTWR